jgi:hypothetical protein
MLNPALSTSVSVSHSRITVPFLAVAVNVESSIAVDGVVVVVELVEVVELEEDVVVTGGGQ